MFYTLKLSTKRVKPKNKTLGYIETKDDKQNTWWDYIKRKSPKIIWVFHVFYVLFASMSTYGLTYVIGYLKGT
jgi:hypothetical protein